MNIFSRKKDTAAGLDAQLAQLQEQLSQQLKTKQRAWASGWWRLASGSPDSRPAPFQLEQTNRQWVDAQIKRIAIANEGESLDFVLNASVIDERGDMAFMYDTPLSQNVRGGPEKIAPVLLASVIEQLVAALESQSIRERRRDQIQRLHKIKLRVIDLNCGQLTPELFERLLDAGIGGFQTETLVLREALSEPHVILKRLRDAIVNEGKFARLKRLDLNINNLTRDLNPAEAQACLQAIQDIVAHVKLEVLDLSDNDTLGTQPCQAFFKALPQQLASLKKLLLRNVGLRSDPQKIGDFEEAQIATLIEVLKKTGLLEHLDLRDNPGLSNCYPSIVEGLKKNFFLQEVLVDPKNKTTVTGIREILTQHQEWFDSLGILTDKQQAPLLKLLNTYLVGGDPKDLSEHLEGTYFSKENCLETVKHIISERSALTSAAQRERMPLSEAEWIAYIQGDEQLQCFYREVNGGTQTVTLTFLDPDCRVRVLQSQEVPAQSSGDLNSADVPSSEIVAEPQVKAEEAVPRANPILLSPSAQQLGAMSLQEHLEGDPENNQVERSPSPSRSLQGR